MSWNDGEEETPLQPKSFAFGIRSGGKSPTQFSAASDHKAYAAGIGHFDLSFNKRPPTLQQQVGGRFSNSDSLLTRSTKEPHKIIAGITLSTFPKKLPATPVTLRLDNENPKSMNSAPMCIVKSAIADRKSPPLELEKKIYGITSAPITKRTQPQENSQIHQISQVDLGKKVTDSTVIEDAKRRSTSNRFISPIPHNKSIDLKSISSNKERDACESIPVDFIFINAVEITADSTLPSIRIDNASRNIYLSCFDKSPTPTCRRTVISYSSIIGVFLNLNKLASRTGNIPNFVAIKYCKDNENAADKEAVCDLSDENVNPIPCALIIMSIEAVGTVRKRLKDGFLAKKLRSPNAEETSDLLAPYFAKNNIDHDVFLCSLQTDKPSSLLRRSTRRSSGGIGLLTQPSDPTDCITYMTYPIEINAQDVITISRGDLKRFEDREYFNDNLIDLKVKHMVFALPPEKRDKVHAFSCLFYPKLKELRNPREAHEAISRWTKNVDIFTMDYVFVPINYSLHWSLCVVVRPILWLIDQYMEKLDDKEELLKGKDGRERDKACLLFLDSLSMHNIASVANTVTNYLSYEWKAKQRKKIAASSDAPSSSSESNSSNSESADCNKCIASCLSLSQKSAFEARLASSISLDDNTNLFSDIPKIKCKVPMQENGFDCGVFVIKYVESLLDIFPSSTQSDIDRKMPQLHGGLFTQREITKERILYRELLREIEVTWRESREKLKTEGALTEDSQGSSLLNMDPEAVGPESQERLRRSQEALQSEKVILQPEAERSNLQDDDDDYVYPSDEDVLQPQFESDRKAFTVIDDEETYVEETQTDSHPLFKEYSYIDPIIEPSNISSGEKFFPRKAEKRRRSDSFDN